MSITQVVSEFSTGDYQVITFSIKINRSIEKENKIKVQDYRRTDFKKLKTTLDNTDWSEISENNDITNVD